MHKKSFTFGLGCGILMMTLLFYFVYGVQIKNYNKAFQEKLENQKNEFSNEQPALSDDFIIQKAKEMGMDFSIENQASDEQTNNEESISAIALPQQEVTPKPITKIIINIPEGMMATEIAILLEESKVIDDAKQFRAYLSEQNSTKNLGTGTFEFVQNSSYEEALNVLKRKSQVPN